MLVRTLGFFLRFFSPGHFGHLTLEAEIDCLPVYLSTCGNHATSVSDEIDQKIKVGQNIRFFLRFFPLLHFDPWKLR